MKVKVTFECEVYPYGHSEWSAVYDELEHTRLDYVHNLDVEEIEEFSDETLD